MNAPDHAGNDDCGAAQRQLPIDFDDLAWALTWQDNYQGSSHWLDLDTGAVVFVADSNDLGEFDVDPHGDERFVRIDAIASSESFRVMENFIDQLGGLRLAQTLARSLGQRKPFRRFKDKLARTRRSARPVCFRARGPGTYFATLVRGLRRRAAVDDAQAAPKGVKRGGLKGRMERLLDTFADSRDLVLRNGIAQSLLRGDWPAAQHRTTALLAEFGDEPALALTTPYCTCTDFSRPG